MKKKLLIIVSLLAAALALVVSGCKQPEPTPGGDGEYTITISDPTLQLDVLDREVITVTVKNPAGETANSQVSWTSSDTSVVTVSNGTVDALKAGTATITATAEGKTAECAVTVSAIVRPLIVVTPTELALKGNGTGNISPSVKFKSRTLDNSEYNITYSFTSSNDEVVTVANNGTVSAKKIGTAEITVTASVPLAASAGIDGNLTQKINVSVNPDYNFVLELKEGSETDLYLKEVTVGSVTHRETSQVVVSEASLNGEAISSGWTFKSSDETVATVSGEGLVTLASTAVENDKVKIYAEYDNDGYKLKSNEIEFTVLKATLDKELDSELLLDLSVAQPTVSAELFGNDFVITDLKDGEKPAVSLWNNGSINKDAITGLGERTLIVESATLNYRVKAWVVSKVLKTATEITDLFNPKNGNAIPKVEGYYILGNDIDASNTAFKYRAWSTADGQGLVGTFDGRGHTVNGLKMNTSGGIFGVVSSTGVVKNVAFTNVEVNSTGHGVILAYFVHGTVENVFVGINKLATTSEASSSTAGLISQTAGAATLKNIVVVNNSEIDAKAGDYGILEAKSNVGAWENVFVVAGDNLFGGAQTSGDEMSKYGKSVQKFATVAELLASNYYNEKKADYPQDIWDITSMTFPTSANYIKAELSTVADSAELKIGEATALVQNSRIYDISSQSNKLSIAGGKVTALQKITADDGVTVTISWGSVKKTVAITTAFETVEVNHGYYSFNKGDLTVTSAEFANIGSVTKVMLGTTNLTSQTTISSNTLTIAQGVIGKTAFGEQNLVITGENKAVTVKLTVAHELNTKADIINLYDYLNANGKIYTGYLILGNDVDMQNATIRNATAGGIAKASDLDFAGVFDGQGHKISNYEVPNAGSAGISIFSKVTGTIKNLRIEDVTVSGKGGALVGNELRDGGKLENIFVSGTIAGDGVANGNALQNFGSSLLVGRISTNNNKITNVVIEVKFSNPEPTLYLGSAFGVMNTGYENATFENCFVVCENSAFAFRAKGENCTLNTDNPPADWVLKAFNTTNNKGNGNYTDMTQAWANTTAAGILTGLGVTNPAA